MISAAIAVAAFGVGFFVGVYVEDRFWRGWMFRGKR